MPTLGTLLDPVYNSQDDVAATGADPQRDWENIELERILFKPHDGAAVTLAPRAIRRPKLSAGCCP